jgi:hypothetical protein
MECCLEKIGSSALGLYTRLVARRIEPLVIADLARIIHEERVNGQGKARMGGGE